MSRHTARRSTTVTCSSPTTQANYTCTSSRTVNEPSASHQWHACQCLSAVPTTCTMH